MSIPNETPQEDIRNALQILTDREFGGASWGVPGLGGVVQSLNSKDFAAVITRLWSAVKKLEAK